MIVAGEQFYAFEFLHAFVQGSDGFHVQMVGGLVEEQAVGAADHHLGEQTAYFLSTGEYFHFLHAIIACKEHPSQEPADIRYILDRRIAHKPFGDSVVVVEFLGIIFWKIGL